MAKTVLVFSVAGLLIAAGISLVAVFLMAPSMPDWLAKVLGGLFSVLWPTSVLLRPLPGNLDKTQIYLNLALAVVANVPVYALVGVIYEVARRRLRNLSSRSQAKSETRL